MMKRLNISAWIALLNLAGFGFIACSDSSTVTSPSPVPAGHAIGFVNGPSAGTETAAPATAEILVAMERAIQDEYHAQYTYTRVLEDFGDLAPFRYVVDAERRHAEAAAGLFLNRSIEVPASHGSEVSLRPILDRNAAPELLCLRREGEEPCSFFTGWVQKPRYSCTFSGSSSS